MRGFLDPTCALAFRCSRRWFDLRATASEKIRHCDGCRREVHWCASDKELEAHAERGGGIEEASHSRAPALVVARKGAVHPSPASKGSTTPATGRWIASVVTFLPVAAESAPA